MGEVAAVLLMLIERSNAIGLAAEKIGRMVAEAQKEGRELTLDEIKTLQMDDDLARDELVRAIEEAEQG